MSSMEVRIVRLEPQHVAASYGFGPGPEPIAWEKLSAFIARQGLDKDGQAHRYFGFNNPSPSAGSPNYGYEQWITVDPSVQPDGEIKIKDFPGGLYAVTRCKLGNITQVWHQLMAWREKSPYRGAGHQWLEEALNPPIGQQIDEHTMELDLYLPIAG